MDYIYKDSLEKKHVGEVEGVCIVPYYEFVMDLDKETIWCHLTHIKGEWHISFIELDLTIDIAHPTDVLWNSEALAEEFVDIEDAYKIAYLIKFIYE